VEISVGRADSVELAVTFSDPDGDAVNSGNWLDDALVGLAVVGRRSNEDFDGTGDDVESSMLMWTFPVSTKIAGAHTDISTSEMHKIIAAEKPADREAIFASTINVEKFAKNVAHEK
jgi:hypothetical protein